MYTHRENIKDKITNMHIYTVAINEIVMKSAIRLLVCILDYKDVNCLKCQ